MTWLARVKPTSLALPTAAPAACASGTLRIVKAQQPHDVAMLFDGRRWHPWTYDAWSTDECVDAFERYVAFHYEVCAKLVEQRGAAATPTRARRSSSSSRTGRSSCGPWR